MIHKAKEFVVDRSRWKNGDGSDYNQTRLFHTKTKMMCCMGFYALACGYMEGDIADTLTLAFLDDDGKKIEKEVVIDGPMTVGTRDVYRVNDTCTLNQASRESELTKLLAASDVTVHFVDHDTRTICEVCRAPQLVLPDGEHHCTWECGPEGPKVSK